MINNNTKRPNVSVNFDRWASFNQVTRLGMMKAREQRQRLLAVLRAWAPHSNGRDYCAKLLADLEAHPKKLITVAMVKLAQPYILNCRYCTGKAHYVAGLYGYCRAHHDAASQVVKRANVSIHSRQVEKSKDIEQYDLQQATANKLRRAGIVTITTR